MTVRRIELKLSACSGHNGAIRRGQIWLVVIVLVAIAGIGGYTWWQFNGSGFRRNESGPMSYKVIRGPFDNIVLEQGELESSSNIDVRCEVKGKGTTGTPLLWVIEEGTYVKKGDELARLDSSALDNERKTQRIVVQAAQAVLISSDAALKQAEISKIEYLDGTFLTEQRAIQSEIALAEQQVRATDLSLASAERLAAKGTLVALQVEAEEFSVKNARNQLESAKGRLRVLQELTQKKMLVQLESVIETAKAKLESDKSILAEEKDKLAEIEGQIALCTIKAPTDGQVVHANKTSPRGGPNDVMIEAGVNIREQQAIIKLPDPTKMQVRARINESKIMQVREGMAVKISVGAVSGELLGRIIKINKYPDPGNSWSSSVKEYSAFIQIFDPPESIRTGMTAEVRIFVEQLPDALQIPVLAVLELQNRHFALVKKGKESYETREIEIGATNKEFVTVAAGLSDDEDVILNPRSHLDKMDLPDIEKVSDRDALAKIANAPMPLTQAQQNASNQSGEFRGRGGPAGEGGRRGGPAGEGGRRGGRRGGPEGGGGRGGGVAPNADDPAASGVGP